MCLDQMATTLHELHIQLELEPRWHQDPPWVTIQFRDQIQWQGALTHGRTFEMHSREPAGPASVTVEMTNKKDSDTVIDQGLDKAVIVKSVVFNGIRDPRFVWQGLYSPRYPVHMLKDRPDPVLRYHDYLGWNGPWTLQFSVPIFTWIHQVRDLGWIHS